ncbi:MAG TPA: flagellar hook-length control protein FliK [Clostridiales bacterium]|nr:flagellar hook-length control protein FliK [Clostridiales bacterium]
MEIKNSILSNYKSGKTKASLGKTPVSTDKLKDASQINKQTPKEIALIDIKEGQTLKGEVVDLRYDSVTIRLEPGDQVVVAKLEGGVDLSIGQTAQFYVAEDGSNRIVLRYLPVDGTSTNRTIDKALTASNIPLTNRNRLLVSELLANQMPVDKNTLSALVRLSHIHHEASPLTLVLMYKYNIPMTDENIQQFEAYQNGSNEIMGKINTLTDGLLELINSSKEADPSSNEHVDAFSNPSQVAETSISSTYINQQLLQLNKDLLQLLDSNLDTNPNHAQFTPDTPIHNIISQEDIALLGKALEQLINSNGKSEVLDSQGASNNTLARIYSGNSPISETIAYSLELLGLEHNPETPFAINTLQDIIADPSFTSLAEPIKELINKYVQNDINFSNSPEINTLLNQEERRELIRLLMPFSNPKQVDSQNEKLIDSHIANQVFGQIDSGEAPIKDLLAYINQNVLKSDAAPNEVDDILQSSVYGKLLQTVIKDRWTITPEKLDQYSVSQLYENLDEDIKHINNMLQLNKDSTELMKLHEPSKGLQDNLSFLKDLNQVFNYLPLPIQFKNQDAHCDLYVLTRKKALNDPSNGLSVLLHLDMEHLGSLNIHLNMKSKNIAGKFYIEDLSSVELLSTHMETLVYNLKKKGYDFEPEVISSYEKPNFTNDFIANELKDNDFSRYTFDVRT